MIDALATAIDDARRAGRVPLRVELGWKEYGVCLRALLAFIRIDADAAGQLRSVHGVPVVMVGRESCATLVLEARA